MPGYDNPHMYNDPNVSGNPGGTDSSVGPQLRVDYYYRKALVEAIKEAYFGQLANVRAMPKNMGKTIKQYHYLPLLDDRNINDQGIDANGVNLAADFIADKTNLKYVIELDGPHEVGGMKYYATGIATGADLATAKAAAQTLSEGKVWAFAVSQMGMPAIDYATAKTALEAGGWVVTVISDTDDKMANYGNLYGSSKDVGTITAKIPALSEVGGRVNRVGFKRIELEGSIEKFGFFDEYTQESLDFDTDSELLMHITTESVKGANELTEAQIQLDLLAGAGVVRFTGDATSTTTISGGDGTAGNEPDAVTYDDLVKLAIELDNNRTPKMTKVITGSRMIDTKVVNAARYMYIGSELIPSVMRMKDYHNEKAYIPVAQYGAATTIARGELGAVHDFRLIVVPEMMHWAAAGAAVADPATELVQWSTDEAGAAKVDVFPMLVVGDASFTTIGFQTDGKTVKFKITHKKPGREIADRSDPYGEVGFYSIKWWYGFMLLRPERIALVKTVAEF